MFWSLSPHLYIEINYYLIVSFHSCLQTQPILDNIFNIFFDLINLSTNGSWIILLSTQALTVLCKHKLNNLKQKTINSSGIFRLEYNTYEMVTLNRGLYVFFQIDARSITYSSQPWTIFHKVWPSLDHPETSQELLWAKIWYNSQWWTHETCQSQ